MNFLLGNPFLFHLLVYLFLCWQHGDFAGMVLHFNLKSDIMILPAPFTLFRISLASKHLCASI